MGSSVDMTHEVCFEYCTTCGKRYAGLLEGDKCYCGDEYNGNGEKQCPLWSWWWLFDRCVGNAAQICGRHDEAGGLTGPGMDIFYLTPNVTAHNVLQGE